MSGPDPYVVQFQRPARRALAELLPESVAAASYEFCVGPLASNPLRVGVQLRPPLAQFYSARRGTYRVVYEVDEANRVVTVAWIGHRAEVYRPR